MATTTNIWKAKVVAIAKTGPTPAGNTSTSGATIEFPIARRNAQRY